MILKEQQQQALASKKRKADVGDAILIQAQKESAVVVGKRAPMPSKDFNTAGMAKCCHNPVGGKKHQQKPEKDH